LTLKPNIGLFIPPIVFKVRDRLLVKPQAAPQSVVGAERGPEYYDKTFENKATFNCRYFESTFYPVWTVLACLVQQREAKRVLDVGCGPGQTAELLGEVGVTDYVGLDFSPARVEQAKRTCPQYDFHEVDVFETDYVSGGEYDIVVCTEFLEHVERDLDLVKAIPAGKFCIFSVPSFTSAGHVRFFESAAQVIDRYGPDFEDITIFPVKRRENQIHYVCYGVRQ